MNVVHQVVRRQPGALWLVLALAALGEVLWFAWVNVGFDMDSVQYLRYANVLAGIKMPYMSNPGVGAGMDFTSISRRTAGYPLLLWLGGVPITGSLIGIMLIQAAMAIAMPVLIYKTLEPYGRRMALIVALILIVSLEPFNYSKTMLTEQSYKFFIVLLVYLAVRASRTPSQPLFAAAAAVSVVLALIRPQANFVAVIVFGMLLIAHPRRWMSLATYFVSVVVTLGFFSFFTALYLAAHVPPEFPAKLRETAGSFQARLENLLLYHLYNSQDYGMPALAAEKGPERARLRLMLQSYAEDHPEEWTKLAPRHFFGAFAGDPSKWVEEIYRNPNLYYLNMIKAAVDAQKKSPDEALNNTPDQLISRVIWESYSATPRHLLSFIARYFLGLATTSGGPISWSQFYTTRLSPFSASNGPASKELVDLMKIYIADFPDYIPADWRNYPGGIDQLIKNAFGQPEESHLWWYWGVVDYLKGPMESGRIFLKSLDEFPRIHYFKSILSMDKLAEYFIAVPSTYQQGSRKYDSGSFFLYAYTSSELPSTMLAELQSGLKPSLFGGPISGLAHYETYAHLYTALWIFARDLINLSIVAMLLFCFRAGNGWPAALIGLLILYNAAVVALVTDTYIRYVDLTMPLSIALAGLSVGSFMRVGLRSGDLQWASDQSAMKSKYRRFASGSSNSKSGAASKSSP